MTFKAGDWVRRKAKHRNEVTWNHGNAALQVTAAWDVYLSFDGLGDYAARKFELAYPPFDPHALAMALVLADLISDQANWQNVGAEYVEHNVVIAPWLRSEVQRELLSQEVPR